MIFTADPVVRQPVGFQQGYWAGAPGAYHEREENFWYLTYRIRRPRGIDPDRGGEARLARSRDLHHWEDIWSVNKSAYGSASIERSAVRKGPDKVWRYFTSFVDPADGRWCVAVLRASDPREFRSDKAEKLFTASPLGLEGVKDPWILESHGKFHMFLSVALATAKTTDRSHATLDIYNTGQCLSATALAISDDLEKWEWQRIVLQPDTTGWDCYCRRINSVLPLGGKFIAFYDGSASHEENYEERTGLATSTDLKTWTVMTPKGAAFVSPHATHSLRYVDAQPFGDQCALFYEFAREDQAHDLRVRVVSQIELANL